MDPETPVEERPPGRGRGSSVALLVGYLIGISHVDPLKWDLTLERFISEDMTTLPDIDLDFPRGLRDELIERVHKPLRARVRRPDRSHNHLQGEGHHPGPRQGPGASAGASVPALEAVALPRRGGSPGRNGAAPGLQGTGGRAGLAEPARSRPSADGRSKGADPARRRHGA